MWSVAVLAVLSAALIVGLTLMGLFEVEDSLRVSTCVPSDEKEFEMALRKDSLSFRPVWEDAFRIPNLWYLSSRIVDQNRDFVRNVSIISGRECQIPPGGEAHTWYCLK